jgi:hypothetical protein
MPFSYHSVLYGSMMLFLLPGRKRFGGFSAVHLFGLTRRYPVPAGIVIYGAAAQQQCGSQYKKQVYPVVFHLYHFSFPNLYQNFAKL